MSRSNATASTSKRPRLVLSCNSCKSRKVKCNKEVPCNNCIRRGEQATCYQEERQYDQPQSAFASRTDVNRLQGQIDHLQLVNRKIVSYLSAEATGLNVPAHLLEDLQRATDQSHDLTEPNGIPSTRGDQTYSDTEEGNLVEEAALVLEDFAMGKARDLARIAETHASPTPSHGTSRQAQPVETGRDRYYPILKQDARPPIQEGAFSLHVPATTQIRLYDAITNCDLRPNTIRFLIDTYFAKVAMHWSVHHEPTFQMHVTLFLELINAGRLEEVDPLFLSNLLSMMSLAVNHTPHHADIGSQLGLSNAQVAALPEIYFNASQRLFEMGETSIRPQIRSIQAILMLSHYFFHNGAKAFTGELDGYYLRLSLGFRTATLLGLHRLADRPETNLKDDTALPFGDSPVKREVGKRLWNLILFIDAINASNRAATTAVPDFLCKPALPTNIDDADIPLASTEAEYGLPLDQMTDQLIELGRYKLAIAHRNYFQKACLIDRPLTYEGSLQQVLIML